MKKSKKRILNSHSAYSGYLDRINRSISCVLLTLSQVTLVASLAFPSLAMADEVTAPNTQSAGSETGLGTEILQDLGSPVTTDSKYVLLGGAALTGALLWFESRTNESTQIAFSSAKPLGSTSKYGDLAGQLVPNAVYYVGMWVDHYFTGSYRARERARLMLESTAWASLGTTVLKYSVREERPDQSDHSSFPSGHSTTIFAFATAVALEHEWYYAVPAYALAVFTAASRVNDNKHYMHDCAAGATIGASYALGTWLQMKRRGELGDKIAADKIATDTTTEPLWSRMRIMVAPDESLRGVAFLLNSEMP